MSREIDQEIAEKVMDWTKHAKSTLSLSYLTERGHRRAIWIDKNTAIENYGWFNPSTDISAAFEVVEKMRERGLKCEINIYAKKSS